MTNRAGAEETAIGPWLLTPVLIVFAIGHGLLNNPHFIIKIMGNNAYWSFPIALVFITPAITAIYFLAKRFPGQNLIQQGKSILGPFLGTITGLAYLGFLLFFLAMLTRDIVNLTSMFFLVTTPIYWMALLYLLAAVWLASRGLETIARTASIIMIPALIIFITLLVLGIPNIDSNELKPVFTPNIIDYLKAGKIAIYNFFTLGFVAMVLPYLKPLKTFPRFAGGTMFLLMAIMGFVAIEAIGINSPEYLIRFAYPSFATFRAINLPYLLLEQSGMVVGIAWLVIILLGSSFGHYTLSLGLSQIAPFFNYKKWAWILAPLKFIVIIWPTGILQTKMMVDFITQIGWIPLFGYPLFLWIMALILKRKGAVRNEV